MPGSSIHAQAWLLLLFISISVCIRTHLCSADDLIRSFPPSAMVFPLVLSINSSRPSIEGNFRRLLRREKTHNTPDARMRLYDDLLANGYYTTRLFIGTPPQEFALIVDTGSTVTYVPCSTCEQCGLHQDPRFQPDLSSTYQPVKCSHDCTCDEENKQCTYERQYAEMSSSSGVLGEDVVSFGKESALQPQRAVFGCENVETGDLFSQHADGIIGLGRGQLSIMDQLANKGVISDSFSLCYGGMGVGGGAMVLGGISPPPGMVFSQSNPARSPYYNVELKEIHVAGKPLQLSPRVFDGKHGTVLDSGTTYAYLPEAAFVAFKDAIVKKLHLLKQIRGPDPNYNDICFSGAGSDVSQLSKSFPAVEMVFKNGQKLSLAPENYLFRHSKVHGAYCLGIFQNGKDLTTLLGGIVVRNTLVTYDRENKRIGFWKTNCSELWERLHISGAPSPAPSASDIRNSTISVAPSLSPSGLPDNLIPARDHSFSGVSGIDTEVNMEVVEAALGDLNTKDGQPTSELLQDMIATSARSSDITENIQNLTTKAKASIQSFVSLFQTGPYPKGPEKVEEKLADIYVYLAKIVQAVFVDGCSQNVTEELLSLGERITDRVIHVLEVLERQNATSHIEHNGVSMQRRTFPRIFGEYDSE